MSDDPRHSTNFNAIPQHVRDLGAGVPGLDPPIWYAGSVVGQAPEVAEATGTDGDEQQGVKGRSEDLAPGSADSRPLGEERANGNGSGQPQGLKGRVWHLFRG
jgi:hypothetical protein